MLNKWTVRRLLRRVGTHFHSTGLVVGTLFFAMSLAPSLVPRTVIAQGVISGLSMSAGYAVGVLLYLFWAYFHLPVPKSRVQWILQTGAGVASLLFALIFLWRSTDWQDSVRSLMGLQTASGLQVVTLAFITFCVFLATLFLARLFKFVFRIISARLGRFVPHRISVVGGLLFALILFWMAFDGVLFRLALQAADRSYQEIDALMEPAIERPVSPLATGSDSSLLDWQDLGRQGRRFLSSGPDAQDIAAFTGAEVMTPLRVYVGLNSAETARERAAMALAELQRVNAFEREVLVLITPTGTGWIDPGSIDTIEYLFRGNVASVAAQYSYLASPLSLLAEAENGVSMARNLFQEVYGHWTRLPPGQRPRLYLQGLSLGALNSDRSFDFYDIIEDPFDGVLWSGPPFSSETWRNVTARRDPDSPVWLPRFREGGVVRFANQHGGLQEPVSDWGSFRIAFLQYGSDPITFFSPDSLYRRPEWLQAPRAFDVSPAMRWFPVVTMLQLAADMNAGAAPPGYGHSYAPAHYHDTWLALTEPPGWTARELAALREMHLRQAASNN